MAADEPERPGDLDPDAAVEPSPLRPPIRDVLRESPGLDAWQDPQPIPVRERDDELLVDPPAGEHHRGRLAGYQAGARMRFIVFGLVVVFIAGGVALMVWWVRNREPEHARQFQLPEGSELSSRPRAMVWSGGRARLGLDREAPGILSIELPDRTLRLADGSDKAQLQVDVEDGKTVALKVLFGEVVEELAPGARPQLAQK